jgi:hypothetical protein
MCDPMVVGLSLVTPFPLLFCLSFLEKCTLVLIIIGALYLVLLVLAFDFCYFDFC